MHGRRTRCCLPIGLSRSAKTRSFAGESSARWLALLAGVLVVLAVLVATCDGGPGRPEAPSRTGSAEPRTVGHERVRRRPRARAAVMPAEAPKADAPPGTSLVAPARPATTLAATNADATTWRVIVLGQDDAPAAGLRLRTWVKDRWAGVVTDGQGIADVPIARDATELDVQLPGLRGVGPGGGQPLRRIVPAPDAVIRLPEIPSLDIVAVDAQTGETLTTALRILVDGIPALRVRSPAFIAAAPFTTESEGFAVEVDPPPGFATQGPRRVVNAAVSRFATRLRLVVPLRREVPLRVRVVDADDRPAAGAEVSWVTLGGTWQTASIPTVPGDSAVAVRGIPFLRGEQLVVCVARRSGDDVWRASSDPTELREPNDPIVVTVRLPRDPEPRDDGRIIGIGGGAGGAFGGRRGSARFLRTGEATAALAIHVTRRSGVPTAGARVRLNSGAEAFTDASGDVTFGDLRAGAYVVHVTEPGFVPTAVSVTLAAGETARVEVAEARGESLEITVCDERGDPLPFATVEAQVHGANGAWTGHVEVNDDIQELAPLVTDAHGRLTLRQLPAGTVRLRAWFGSRSAAATVTAPGAATLRLGSSD